LKKLFLFTDGSVNVKNGIGCGSYLITAEQERYSDDLKNRVKSKRFENTSSTKLELQTLLWALKEIETDAEITICTDSQNIIGLLKRRKRLEENNFYSQNGSLLKNHEMYKSFYLLMDGIHGKVEKMKGHQPSKTKNELERIFSLVDKSSRRMLKKECNK
jgi:ribonuclease HI